VALSEIDDRAFADVLAKEEPAVVDLWAPWCAPCRALGPRLERLAEAFAGRIRFFKLNVDDNPETPARYGVMSIPTLLLVRDGEVRGQVVGLRDEATLRAAFEDLLAGEGADGRPAEGGGTGPAPGRGTA
jgi:thioredoxin